MKSIRGFTDIELDDQLYNAKMDLEEAETNGDRNHALAELEVAKKEKERRRCNCYICNQKDNCQYVHKFQRLPRISGGLGLCKKLN